MRQLHEGTCTSCSTCEDRMPKKIYLLCVRVLMRTDVITSLRVKILCGLPIVQQNGYPAYDNVERFSVVRLYVCLSVGKI